jgi:hypothetical protein
MGSFVPPAACYSYYYPNEHQPYNTPKDRRPPSIPPIHNSMFTSRKFPRGCISCRRFLPFSSVANPKNNTDFRPRRIILLRHGQSMGNVDESAYVNTADWRIPLTDLGRKQAHGEDGHCHCDSDMLDSKRTNLT